MARTVVNNDTVAHLWAHQTQPDARSGTGAFSFVGPALFSYSTCIARLMTAPDGSTAAVFSSETYSVTTNGKHKGPARAAVSHLTRFSVPPGNGDSRSAWSTMRGNGVGETPAGVRASFAAKILEAGLYTGETRHGGAKAKRFRDWEALAESANRFCAFFGLEPFPVPTVETMGPAVAALIAEKARKDAEAAEARRAATAKRLAELEVRADAWKAGRQ